MARLAAILFLLAPQLAWAESTTVAPEQLLSLDSAVYVRFDGVDAHRPAFDRTAFGEAMKGDFGDFVDYLGVILQDSVGPALLKQQLLDGTPSSKLGEMRRGLSHLPAAIAKLGRHGAVLGLEILAVKPIPRAQLTLVLPGDVASPDIQGALRLIPTFADIKAREYQLEGRTIHEIPTKAGPFLRVTWWQEGQHTVLVVGSEGPPRTISTARGKHPNLLANPLYQSLLGFRHYESAARGYIDLERIVGMIRGISADASKIVDATTLGKVRNLTGYFGFEGRKTRSTLFASLQPAAAASMVAAEPTGRLDFERLPPFPHDAGGIFALDLDLAQLYDAKVDLLSAVVPGGKAAVANAIDSYKRTLGIDVRKDLLAALGSVITIFNSPSDAPFNLGVGIAIQVKDVPRLESTLNRLFKSLPAALGVDVSVKKDNYHGTVVNTLQVVAQGFPITPTFAVQPASPTSHDAWLVAGIYPQPVHGFILRATGKAAAWKPDEMTLAAVEATREGNPRARILSLAVTDPRAALNRLAALAPFIGGSVNSFAPGTFDLQKLPHAQALTESLFPNVTILAHDGTTTCLDSRFSLPLPVTLLDPAALLALALDLARIR